MSKVNLIKQPNDEINKETENLKNYDNDIQGLKEENKVLTDKLTQLLAIFETMTNKTDTISSSIETQSESKIISEIKEKYSDLEIPDEPAPNKSIRVMNLCYGALTLKDGTGATRLPFDKYGEIKPILYSSLIDVVNANRSFADDGKFYVLDKNAVYHLGLNNDYKKIVDGTIIDNICNYSEVQILDILKTIPESQREVIVKTLKDRIYNGEEFNLNKIAVINKYCNVDIMDMVEQMKEFSNIKK